MMDWLKAYRQAARDRYADSDCDISFDVEAAVSESDEGAYVQAWVWVPRSALGESE
jgi:hypothetical protein